MNEDPSHLQSLYLNKPECVIDLPDAMLSRERREALRRSSRLSIVEIAGRDSVAAAVGAVEQEGFTELLPTYVYTGTEYGSWSSVEEAVRRLRKRLSRTKIHDLLVLGSPGFWQALNGRFVSELVARYGFYTPCVGCHVYLHSVRIPLALNLGGVPIIAGERESHDGAVKVNQGAAALEGYGALAGAWGIRLLFPLRHLSRGADITDILGFDWEQGEDQLGCVLSGNYKDLEGRAMPRNSQVKQYLGEFALPCAGRILTAYGKGRVPDHLAIAKDLLGAGDVRQREREETSG